jgi:hypothetical protein
MVLTPQWPLLHHCIQCELFPAIYGHFDTPIWDVKLFYLMTQTPPPTPPHVFNFKDAAPLSKTIGQIKLSEEQIADQLKRSVEQCLSVFEAQKITYPGKGFDAWWDLTQLIDQIKITIKVFEFTHPNCIGVFSFDRSSAHEGFAEDEYQPWQKAEKAAQHDYPIQQPRSSTWRRGHTRSNTAYVIH